MENDTVRHIHKFPHMITVKASHQTQLCNNPPVFKYLWASADDSPPLLYYLSAEVIHLENYMGTSYRRLLCSLYCCHPPKSGKQKSSVYRTVSEPVLGARPIHCDCWGEKIYTFRWGLLLHAGCRRTIKCVCQLRPCFARSKLLVGAPPVPCNVLGFGTRKNRNSLFFNRQFCFQLPFAYT